MLLPVEIEYHNLPDIFQVNMLIWPHFITPVCITLNISSQQIKMITFGPCVMNALSILHKVPYMLYFKCQRG